MKKSALFSDVFFAFSGFALFSLCLFRFLGIRLLFALLLALVCGALAAGAAWAYLRSKRKALLLKKSDERTKEKLLVHLALLSDEKKTEFFLNAFRENGNTPKRFSKLRIFDEERFCFLFFRFSPVTADEVGAISRWKTSKKKLLLCGDIDSSAEALCAKLGVEVCKGEQVYALLKARGALPQTYLGETQENSRGKRRRLCFSKRNGKRFFVSGTLVLLLSLLTPFPYYYLVFGSILLAAALFIRIFGYA